MLPPSPNLEFVKWAKGNIFKTHIIYKGGPSSRNDDRLKKGTKGFDWWKNATVMQQLQNPLV